MPLTALQGLKITRNGSFPIECATVCPENRAGRSPSTKSERATFPNSPVRLRPLARVRMFPASCAYPDRQMARLLAFLALGTALAGCSGGYSIPSMDMSLFSSSPSTVAVRVESNPSGAEARSTGGTSCRTPCMLAVPGSGVSDVTFSLQGYLPQTVAVNITTTREGSAMQETGMAEQIRIDPNPVFALLQQEPPPPPARKRAPSRPKPKPQPTASAAPPPPPAQPAQQGWGPPQQQQPAQQGWGPPQQQQPGFR